MNKKKLLLLPIIGGFLLSGCKFTLFGKTIRLFEKDEQKQQDSSQTIDDVEPEDTSKHATSLSQSPNTPFMLKIGEIRTVSVSFDQTPSKDEEKIFEWKLQGTAISYTVQTNSAKADITGVRAGHAELTAINKYNNDLKKTFYITVIEFDEEKDYLWQYNSDDKAQFGYTSEQKAGTKKGDAVLAGMIWHYERSSVESLNVSQSGYIGFGAGSKPETHLHFETDNSRGVKSIAFEATSAHSLAKMTVKVGETVFMNEMTVPRLTDDIQPLVASKDEAASGNIVIDVYTPEFEEGREDDPTYYAPGAFSLKSIRIAFESAPEFKTTKTFNFKEMYDDEEDTILHNLSKTASEKSFVDGDFSVYFKSVKKEADSDEKIPGYAHSNGYIDVLYTKPGEVISMVEFKFTYGTTSSKNVYNLEVSKAGGTPFTNVGSSSDANGSLISYVHSDNINAIRLNVKNSYNVGLEYLTIKTRDGVQASIKEIQKPATFAPKKTSYVVGEAFDPDGLGNLTIVYNEEGISNDILPISELVWYDGPSYDLNPAEASLTLKLGTTYVYGIFRAGFYVTVEGLTVQDLKLSLSLIKNTNEITSADKFYIIAPASKALLKSSSGSDMSKAAGVETLSLATVGDEIEISAALKNDYFTIEPLTSGKFTLKATTGHYIGLTNSGNISINKDAPNKDYTLTIDAESGLVTFMIQKNDGSVTKYFGFDGSKFAMSADEIANIGIYKLN